MLLEAGLEALLLFHEPRVDVGLEYLALHVEVPADLLAKLGRVGAHGGLLLQHRSCGSHVLVDNLSDMIVIEEVCVVLVDEALQHVRLCAT